eukprot:4898447-Amphidinium_carterae.1
MIRAKHQIVVQGHSPNISCQQSCQTEMPSKMSCNGNTNWNTARQPKERSTHNLRKPKFECNDQGVCCSCCVVMTVGPTAVSETHASVSLSLSVCILYMHVKKLNIYMHVKKQKGALDNPIMHPAACKE